MSDVESAAQAAYPDVWGGMRDREAFRAGWVARDVEVAELRAMLAEVAETLAQTARALAGFPADTPNEGGKWWIPKRPTRCRT